MAAPNGLHDLTWDSASCSRIAFGVKRITLTKLSMPKVETKVEKVARVGEARATKRTPGRTEIADATAELLATDYQAHILPEFNRHGSNLITFPVVTSLRHPSIAGSFNTLLDDCRIIAEEYPELDGSEKGLLVKLTLSVMQVWRMGSDQKWKCLSYEAALPSSSAKALGVWRS